MVSSPVLCMHALSMCACCCGNRVQEAIKGAERDREHAEKTKREMLQVGVLQQEKDDPA